MKSLTRASDIVARYGGEEFLVLSPSTDAQGAQELAERIRSKTQSHKFAVNVENGESSDVEVTVSAGVAQYSRDSEYSQPAADGGKLVKLADEALYLAKNQGRNRVVSSKESSKVSSKETSKESCKDSAIEHDFLQELGSNSPLPETATPQFAMANASRS